MNEQRTATSYMSNAFAFALAHTHNTQMALSLCCFFPHPAFLSPLWHWKLLEIDCMDFVWFWFLILTQFNLRLSHLLSLANRAFVSGYFVWIKLIEIGAICFKCINSWMENDSADDDDDDSTNNSSADVSDVVRAIVPNWQPWCHGKFLIMDLYTLALA